MTSLKDRAQSLLSDLLKAGIELPEATREVELILEHVTGYSASQRMLHSGQELPADVLTKIEAIKARRLAREPLQYIFGRAAFAGLDLVVGPGVFIPRSDTEVLFETALKLLAEKKACRFAEACAGSGAISLALLNARADLKGFACEKSPAAFEYAVRNTESLGLQERFTLELADWRQWAENLEPRSFAAFLSNPPYIPRSEASGLLPEIAYEPESALFGEDPDGLRFYREAAVEAEKILEPGGFVALEVGDSYAREALDIFNTPPWIEPMLVNDLAGRPRVLVVKLKNSPF